MGYSQSDLFEAMDEICLAIKKARDIASNINLIEFDRYGNPMNTQDILELWIEGHGWGKYSWAEDYWKSYSGKY